MRCFPLIFAKFCEKCCSIKYRNNKTSMEKRISAHPCVLVASLSIIAAQNSSKSISPFRSISVLSAHAEIMSSSSPGVSRSTVIASESCRTPSLLMSMLSNIFRSVTRAAASSSVGIRPNLWRMHPRTCSLSWLEPKLSLPPPPRWHPASMIPGNGLAITRWNSPRSIPPLPSSSTLEKISSSMYCLNLLVPSPPTTDEFPIMHRFISSSETVPSPFRSIDRKMASESFRDRLWLRRRTGRLSFGFFPCVSRGFIPRRCCCCCCWWWWCCLFC
mmetsp:Transcript_22007/g.61220  ORF Transcript_22007/g.61220 Transcript_22007/m.61220 type:complete len:273 (+) Transcript_22007:485-1303(+)